MTIPKAEYAVLDVRKLRAGIKALAFMSDARFVVALKAVPSLIIGRPSKT